MKLPIAAGSNGLGVSLADPAAVESAVLAAVAAGIPVITLNSGVDLFKELGALTHVGQTEIVAGNGAGERFNALGATKVLCARQEQSNVGLEQRCEGLAETFSGEVVSRVHRTRCRSGRAGSDDRRHAGGRP